jgi:HlyD family secretion protein
VEVAAVTTGPFEAGIDEDGRTRLRDRYTISAPLSGRLSRIVLREGDAVEANAVVATVSASLPPMLDRRALGEQQARLDAAEAQVERAKARIARADVAVREALQQLQRNEQLRAKGFLSQAQLDDTRLAEQAARQEWKTAREEHHVAVHEAAQARAALAVVKETGNAPEGGFVVRSPIAGRVMRVLQQSASVVQAGTPLLEIGDTGQLEVLADYLTTDAMQIKPGAIVHIGGWGGDMAMQGRVRLVEPSAFTKVSALGVEEQRVRVLIDLTGQTDAANRLGDGYRVAVRVVTLALPQATQAPVGAVFPLPGDGHAKQAGSMGAFTVRDGRARLAAVSVGARNEHQIWIRQGLDAGATVVMYPPAGLKDGDKVSVRRP